ncbi:unnamed protein product [Pieris macdunnoughi]|uniref:Endonuclease/exonuclease/phosphatase domain-containing protein n=1 Tax=Pieris macdunnoughi TaxID=345717 RepID=A0A821XTB6_9NEOP|nr:unnamed protein product [Pieris macdunnoughi]
MIHIKGISKNTPAEEIINAIKDQNPSLKLEKFNIKFKRNNRNDIEPETDNNDTLNTLENFIIQHPHASIAVCGDFNAWHTLWGGGRYPRSNRRGHDLVDLMSSADLHLCNVGNTLTFETITHGRPRSSIIDLSFSTTPLFNKITHWEVRPNLFPSTQHNIITYKIKLQNPSTATPNQSTFLYRTKNANWHTFKENLLSKIANSQILDTNFLNISPTELDSIVERTTRIINDACTESFPVKTSKHTSKAPFWDDHLEHLKTKCNQLHRILYRTTRSNNTPSPDLIEQYRDTKENYASEIRRA